MVMEDKTIKVDDVFQDYIGDFGKGQRNAYFMVIH